MVSVKEKYFALFRREPTQIALEFITPLDVGRRRSRYRRNVSSLADRPLLLVGSKDVDAHAPGNREDPARETPPRFIPNGSVHHAHEGLLKRISGCVPISQIPQAKPKHPGLVSGIQRFERGDVTTGVGSNESIICR